MDTAKIAGAETEAIAPPSTQTPAVEPPAAVAPVATAPAAIVAPITEQAPETPIAAPAEPSPAPEAPPSPEAFAERIAALEESLKGKDDRIKASEAAMVRSLVTEARILPQYARVFTADNPGFDPFAADAPAKVAAWCAENPQLLSRTAQESAPKPLNAAEFVAGLPGVSIFSADQMNEGLSRGMASALRTGAKLGLN